MNNTRIFFVAQLSCRIFVDLNNVYIQFSKKKTEYPSLDFSTSWENHELTIELKRWSKNFPTYPWNIPQTPDQEFMKEFFESFGVLVIHEVCETGVCWGVLLEGEVI